MTGPTGSSERLEALPFHPDGGEILLVCSGDVIRATPSGTHAITLYGRDDAGERVLATYTLHHSAASTTE